MKYRGYIQLGILLLLIPLAGIIYCFLNKNNGQVHNLMTALDRSIPFSSYFIVPYIAWYVLIFVVLIFFLRKDERLYYACVSSIILSLLISYGVYYFYQTTVPRPVVIGHDVFSNLTRILYKVDNPYNTFPSIHVMTSYIIFLASNKIKEYSSYKLTMAIKGSVVLVIVSTLFLKQHTLLDVVGGLLLGGTLFSLSNWIIGSLDNTNNKVPGAKYGIIDINSINTKHV